jgi:hypothetical protein
VRAELLVLLLLALRAHGAVLAENGITVVGDRGADALRGGPAPSCRIVVPFKLAWPARVWAEADGLQSQRHDSDGAPEAFIDDQYLGPLLAEHGVDWRSPQAVQLSPGAHVLILRCAQVPDANDVRMEKLRVMSDPAPKPMPRPRAAYKRAKVQSIQTELSPAPEPPATGPAPEACAHLLERVDWPAEESRRGKTLSVFSGRSVDGGSLVHLKAGEAWTLLVKVPREADGNALGLAAAWKAAGPGRRCFLFYIDPEAAQAPKRDPSDYRPNTWEPLRFEYCGDRLAATFARNRPISLTWTQPEVELLVGAQGLELGLKPASPH